MKEPSGRYGIAWLVSLGLHGLLILLLALLHLGLPAMPPRPTPGGGLSLALGVEDGQETTPALPPSGTTNSPTEPTESVKPNPTTSPSVTQDQDEAPVVAPKPETKPMDPRLQRLLQRQGQNNSQNSNNQASKGQKDGSETSNSTGLSGSGGFSARGDGLENRGFSKSPDPEEFRILDARVIIPIEVDSEGKVRVTGPPTSDKPLNAQQRRALVEATQNSRFRRNSELSIPQKGVLVFELQIKSRS
ncbi:MAG: hypothetical protein ACKOPP_05850 [Bacteroidota bacterium]